LVVNLNNTWKPLTALGGYDDALARQMSGSTLDLVVFIVKVCPGIGAASSARLEALLSSRANVETVFGGQFAGRMQIWGSDTNIGFRSEIIRRKLKKEVAQ